MDEVSAITAVRTEQWRTRRRYTLSVAAILAVFFDIVTTHHALTTEGYFEANLVLAKLAEIHVGVALLVHSGFAFLIVLVAWHSFGWLSVATGWFAVIAFGGAGITNLVGYVSGTSLSDLVSVGSAIVPHVMFPLAGFITGVLFAYRNYRTLPGQEVFTVGTVLLSSTILPLLLI